MDGWKLVFYLYDSDPLKIKIKLESMEPTVWNYGMMRMQKFWIFSHFFFLSFLSK